MTSKLKNSIIVVGAGRSGTTMIREALEQHSDLAVCDYELNYLWRHGNSKLEHDMLDPAIYFTESNAVYIRSKLSEYLKESGKPRLVDKTVANVLRIQYVHAVMPDAKFVHVIRDGRAVTASAIKRWKAKPKASYYFSKARTIPLHDLLRVAFRYLLSRIKGIYRKKDYIQSWGPRWPGIDNDVKKLSLPEICSLQWKISVQTALEQKNKLPKGQYMEVRYEDIVRRPSVMFEQIADFLEIDPQDANFKEHINSQIKKTSMDKWKSQLTDNDLEKVLNIIGPLLKELGYI